MTFPSPDEAASAGGLDTTEEPEPIISRETVIAREMAAISDQLKQHKGALEDLEARYEFLQDKLLEIWTLNGTRYRDVDGRRIYSRAERSPKYRERPVEEGGGKYTAADAVEALRRIGRASQISPETVNWQTLRSILMELSESEEGVPAALAAIVTLDHKMVVRVGKPK